MTQEKRRCCLLNIEYGLTDEEAPGLPSVHGLPSNRAMPDEDMIQTTNFCPNDVSHVLEKYWDHLACLDQHDPLLLRII
jgi:hypothetical protein